MKGPLPRGRVTSAAELRLVVSLERFRAPIAFSLLFALAVLVTANSSSPEAEKNTTANRTSPTLAQTAETPVPPFFGTHSETWEEFTEGFGLANGTSVLGGIATISGEGSMLTENTFQMCSVFGHPSDGMLMMDQDRPYDLVTISFSQPVSAFGAYWGSGYHCQACCGYPASPTILTFKDANGNVIGSDSFNYQGDGTLLWHGYAFATPVKTIIRSAEDNREGFAMDGLQATMTSRIGIASLTRPAPNTIHLNCLGVPNVINRIEWSPDLTPGSFNTLASIMANATGAFQYDDTSAGTKKFYRVAYP